jgi:hypothetical protein
MKFKQWLESSYEDLIAKYMQIEPQILNHQDIQKDLAEIGYVKHKTIQALGIGEGEANFFTREFNKRHENPQQQRIYQQQQDELDLKQRRDEFYYHVLPANRLKSVMKNGLKPGQQPVFSNYKNHSAGKIFLCEKEGVQFWSARIEDHLFHNGENQKISVIKIKKDAVEVNPDSVGSDDSRSPCYYMTSAVSPQSIQVVK